MGQPGTASAEAGLSRLPAPLRAGLALALWLLVLAVVAVVASDVVSAVLRPIIELGAGLMLAEPLAVEHVKFASVQNVPVYELRAVVETPWEFTNHTVPVDSAVQVTVPRAHSLYHVVIVFAVVLAWPSDSLRHRATSLALGAVAVLVAAFFDAPAVMAAQAHALFFEQFAPARLDDSVLIKTARFLDHGGRLALGAIMGVVAAGTARRLQPTARK